MAPNPRVSKAFRAMREIGIPEEKTKPVLKNLLKLYEKNWELIEVENYRALADAIFDSEEAEAAEQKKKLIDAEATEQKKKLEQAERMKAIEEEAQAPEEPERPLKRLRLRYQDSQASPSGINSSLTLKKPKLEVDELPEAQPRGRNKGKQPVLPNALAEMTHAGVTTETEHDSLKDKGKEPLLPQTARRETRSVSGRPSSAVRFKEPKVRTLALVKPKDEPFTEDTPLPLAVIMPEPLTNGEFSTENDLVRKLDGPQPFTSESTEKKYLNDSVQAPSNETSGQELAIIPDESMSKLDIASSSSGEVKLSLICNSALGKRNLSATSVDTILKTMEDKCLKSYKVADPNFSVKKLMNDMCECLLDLENEAPCNDVDNTIQPVIEHTQNDCETDKPIEQNGFENTETLVVQPNNQSIPGDIKSPHGENDIAKGQEKVIISLVNEVNDECPPSFHYIPQNAVFQSAYVNFSLARIGDDNSCSACFGDCLKASTPCACALQTGGEYAYTIEGLVREELLDECIKMNRNPRKHCLFYCKECPLERSKNEEVLEPCKGHSLRSFIKECWLKCGCNKQCGNRVVQRGIQHKLQVFMTPGGKGWGLRTLEDLPKGAFVCEYVGEVLTNAELYDRVARSSKDEHAYPVLLDADWGAECELKDEEALCLDATYYGNVARFINHRCVDSNLVEIPVEVENPDHHYYHLAFFTTKKVKALEELTWDYGIDFDDDDHPVKAFRCRCGSRFCRNIKRSNRSRRRRVFS